MANEDRGHQCRMRNAWCFCCSESSDSVQLVIHHHTGRRGLGQRANDEDAFPLCTRCHDDFHAGRGVFKGMSHAEAREWQNGRARLAKHLWLLENEVF